MTTCASSTAKPQNQPPAARPAKTSARTCSRAVSSLGTWSADHRLTRARTSITANDDSGIYPAAAITREPVRRSGVREPCAGIECAEYAESTGFCDECFAKLTDKERELVRTATERTKGAAVAGAAALLAYRQEVWTSRKALEYAARAAPTLEERLLLSVMGYGALTG